MTELHILTPARKEVEQASDYYEEQRAGLGAEFIQAFQDALDEIQLFPKAWSKLGDNCWRRRLGKFPYGVVYCIAEQTIYVVAVMHLRCKPGYWKDRLHDL